MYITIPGGNPILSAAFNIDSVDTVSNALRTLTKVTQWTMPGLTVINDGPQNPEIIR